MVAEYDLDKDGKIRENEVEIAQLISEVEGRERKEKRQGRLVWIAMLSMVIVTFALMSDWVSTDRVDALADLLGMFYIAQAGVIATYFGSQAYISRR